MLILASSSPRRKELLSMAGIKYVCIPSDADETVPEGIDISKVSEYLAQVKAEAVLKRHPSDTVIGADTTVAVDGTLLGKPKDENDAFRMIRLLSGRTHTVYTGVSVMSASCSHSFTSATDVEFYDLPDSEILEYIRTGEPMDKAGAYGIQGYGSVLVKKISGDFFTVMGLPIAETIRVLRSL